MSCEKCSDYQEEILNMSLPIAYVRIEEANVAVIGCEKHIKILLDKLRSKK